MADSSFTVDEIGIINDQKKLDQDLPTYYNASTKQESPISREFESYLILESKEHKQKTLSWIKDVEKIQFNKVDRDKLLDTYLTNCNENANTKIAELDEKLNNFDDFKSGLLGKEEDPLRYANVTELSLMSQSLQKPIDEMVFMRDKASHEINMVSLMQAKQKLTAYNSDTQKELQSWQSSVSAYDGQSSSPQKSTGSDKARSSIE